MKADRAEHTVDSGAWKGGLMDEMMEGVNTRTLGLFAPVCSPLPLPPGCVGGAGRGVKRDVRSGRKAWMVRIGCRRCVLKRLAKLEGGIVAMGEVW